MDRRDTGTIENGAKGFYFPFAAEFVGTFVFVLVGVCGEAQIAINGDMGNKQLMQDFLPYFFWGLGLAAAYFIAGGISGGHFNSSVTVALKTTSKVDRFTVLYVVGQMLGSFLGVLVAYALVVSRLQERYTSTDYDHEVSAIFAPQQRTGHTLVQSMLSSFVASSLFMVILAGISDRRNMKVHRALYGISIGLFGWTLVTATLSNAWFGSVIINPSMDFGLRLFNSLFSITSPKLQTQWLVAIPCYLASTIGAIFGMSFYVVCVEYHWDNDKAYPMAPVGRYTTSLLRNLRANEDLLERADKYAQEPPANNNQ